VEDEHVRLIRIVLATVALALALVAVLVAVDVGRWRDQIERGDRALAADPRTAVHWTPATIVPFDPARRLVGLDDDIALRRAIRQFAIAIRVPRGFDNGVQRARTRALAEASLELVLLHGSPRQVAQADVLLGVLAFGTSSAPVGVTAPGERSVEAFAEAARLDPGNLAAKFDLELALRALAPKGTRPGSNPSAAGTGAGRHGAGAGVPGRGF
jgi:hypothetical protein